MGIEKMLSNDAPMRDGLRLKICFLSEKDPHDQMSWSGITFHLFKQMSRFHEMHWVSPWRAPLGMSPFLRRILWLWNKSNKALKRRFTSHNFVNAFFLGVTIKKKIRGKDYDLIVVGAGESQLIAFLDTGVPIIYIADTTFNNMLDYYPWHTNLSRSAIRQGHSVERRAISRSAQVIYSSEWAADSAIKDYGADKKNVSILSFGANVMRLPTRQAVLEKKQSGKCRLLFIGVHWLRKGGDIAYNTFLELRKAGVPSSLTIIGCSPSLETDPDLRIIPYLDKNKETDFAEFYRIFLESDILLIPTRADCTPIVFSEAAAFGLPVITTETGGIRSVIQEGINGFCLPYDATPLDYSQRIAGIWQNREQFRALVVSSRNEYERRLNWEQWITSFNAILEKLRAEKRLQPSTSDKQPH